MNFPFSFPFYENKFKIHILVPVTIFVQIVFSWNKVASLNIE